MASLSRISLALFSLVTLLAVVAAACGGERQPTDEGAGPLRMGLLLNFSEGFADVAGDRRQAFDLAVKHINQGGGVFGQPVEVVVGDSTLDPEKAVAEARRMVEVEGIHVLVGPTTSANTLPVAEQATGPAGIPTVSPSATSPMLTEANDRDFLFRTALSDSIQGPVLARVTSERGFDNVGVIYRNDAWGQGLANAFDEAWTGEVRVVPIEPDDSTFLPQLRQSAEGGAQALVLLTFGEEATIILREALDNGLYDQFTFGDGLRIPGLTDAVGREHLAGMYGTGSSAPPGGPALVAWQEAYADEHGTQEDFAYDRETYDAAIALALAAQAAGSVDGTAVRDQLRSIGSGTGTKVIPGGESVAEGLRILGEGGSVDYDGAAATLDWDERGDLRRGHVGVWRFTRDGEIEELEVVAVGE